MEELIIILIILVCLLFLLIFINKSKFESFNSEFTGSVLIKNGAPTNNFIPKIIWSFWNDEDIPGIVKACINSWKKYNPGYQIVIINENNVNQYLPDINIHSLKNLSDSWARISDVIRLNLLKKYGGFWIDSSMICNKSLQWILDIQQKNKVECIAYYFEEFTDTELLHSSPVIESWFICAVTNSNFIKEWCDEFMSINNYSSVDDYLKTTVDNGTSLQKIDIPNYLAIHVAAQKILQKPNNFNLFLMNAIKGPYFYHYDNVPNGGTWDIKRDVDRFLTGKYKNISLIKLRGGERNYIIDNNLNYDKMF